MGVSVSRSSLRRAFVLLAVPALLVAGCGGEPVDGGSAVGGAGPRVELVRPGTLSTCVRLPFEPFEFRDPDSGEIVGFDIDLGGFIAEELGVEQEIVETSFARITSGADLDDGVCDIAISGVTITEERARDVDFGEPYFNSSQALLAGVHEEITGMADLHGRRLGVKEGTTGEAYAVDHNERNGSLVELVRFPDQTELTSAVRSGLVDAVLSDNGPLYGFARVYRDTSVKVQIDTGEQYGFAVRRGNTALLDVANEVLAAMRADGRHVELHRTWLGVTPNQL